MTWQVLMVRLYCHMCADLPLTLFVTWWAMRVGCAQEGNRSRGAGEVIFHTASGVGATLLAQITVNLVDPASSHMLVSKIKPCMSQHKRFTARLQMAH